MFTLKTHREEKFLPQYQSLPPTVQDKVCLIEELFEKAIIYLQARDSAPAGVPDFDSLLIETAKNMTNATEKDLEEKLQKGDSGNGFPGFNYDYWIKRLGDSSYKTFPDLSYIAFMLAALWIYWLTWPFSRRHFEGRKEMGLIDLVPTPPSGPSFEVNLDHSLVSLSQSVGTETTNIRHWWKKKEGPIRANIAQRTKTSNKVTDAFHQVSKNPGDSLNRIVTRIYKHLIKTGQTKLTKRGKISPAERTIARTLEANNALMTHYFHPEQRGKSKRLVYKG